MNIIAAESKLLSTIESSEDASETKVELKIYHEGERDDGLMSEAGKIFRQGLNLKYGTIVLKDINRAQCEPPLGDDQVEKCARQTHKAEAKKSDMQLNDQGNAIRLLQMHGEDVRYCFEMKSWYVWNGCYWAQDKSEEINSKAKTTMNAFYKASVMDMRKFANKSINVVGINSMIKSARHEPGVPIDVSEFDVNKDILCVSNGYIDLETGALMPHERNEFCTRSIPINYAPDAKCPLFDQFLLDIFIGDQEKIAFMQRWFGYALTGHTSEQVFMIMEGDGANGKGTLIDTINDIMADYAKVTDPDTITHKKYGRGIPNDLAALRGARLVTTSENEVDQKLDEGRIKRLTGQDKISCRFLNKEFFEYEPEFSLILMTNNDFDIQGMDDAIWRRVLKVHFEASFRGDEMDIDLRDKLMIEKDGILRWIVEGAKMWYAEGLCAPESVKMATQEYREELDSVQHFITECCTIDPMLKSRSTELYSEYVTWCKQIKVIAKSKGPFGKSLKAKGHAPSKSDGIRYNAGLDVVNPMAEAQEFALKFKQ